MVRNARREHPIWSTAVEQAQLPYLNNPTALFHNWHPPLVAFVWRLLNQLPLSLDPQYANLFIFMNMLYWIGLVLAIRPWRDRKPLWIMFFLCAGFFPPSFGIISQTIKDSLMCAALMGAYGTLLMAQRQGSKTAFICAIFCLFLAIGFRHNALFAVLPFAIWAGFICLQNTSHSTWRKKTLAGIAIFITLLGTISCVNYLLTAQSSYPVQQLYTYDLVGISAVTGHIYLPEFYDDYKKPPVLTAQSSYPVQQLYTYDLVGISAVTGHIYLPEFYDDYKKPPVLKSFFKAKGQTIKASPLTIENIRLLHSSSNMSIYFSGPGKGLRFVDTEDEMKSLQSAWIMAILQEPVAYLKIRTELYLTLLGLRPYNLWYYYCTNHQAGNDGVPRMTMPHFYRHHHPSWLFKHIMYLVVILVLFVIACWKKNIFPVANIALGASALLYAGSHFIVSASPDFRYLYWLLPVSTIMVFNMGFTILDHRKRA